MTHQIDSTLERNSSGTRPPTLSFRAKRDTLLKRSRSRKKSGYKKGHLYRPAIRLCFSR